MSGLIIAEMLTGIFRPAAELIDNLHTSDEEKIDAKTRLLEVEAAVLTKAYDYEARALEAKSRIVAAEAASEHWLAAVWRPITMLTFLVLVVLDSFGVLELASGNSLPDEAWLLLQIGIGGYVVSRGVEKINKDRIVKNAVR